MKENILKRATVYPKEKHLKEFTEEPEPTFDALR
uniref:Nitroreductase n=1 Tax=Ascaris lumbricoides TaxID=6252 RepID=A0A0M3HWT3_ASCLU